MEGVQGSSFFAIRFFSLRGVSGSERCVGGGVEEEEASLAKCSALTLFISSFFHLSYSVVVIEALTAAKSSAVNSGVIRGTTVANVAGVVGVGENYP